VAANLAAEPPLALSPARARLRRVRPSHCDLGFLPFGRLLGRREGGELDLFVERLDHRLGQGVAATVKRQGELF